jgi:hypothetical protein
MILPTWSSVRVVFVVMTRGSAIAEAGTGKTAIAAITKAKIDRLAFIPLYIEYPAPPVLAWDSRPMKV